MWASIVVFLLLKDVKLSMQWSTSSCGFIAPRAAPDNGGAARRCLLGSLSGAGAAAAHHGPAAPIRTGTLSAGGAAPRTVLPGRAHVPPEARHRQLNNLQ